MLRSLPRHAVNLDQHRVIDVLVHHVVHNIQIGPMAVRRELNAIS
jgi:hypothetical protein